MNFAFLAFLGFIVVSSAAQCPISTCDDRGTINVAGAFISQDKVSLINANGDCCRWDPTVTGAGQPVSPLAFTLHMQTTDDILTATNDTVRDLTIQLSGGDLALRACFDDFSFSLLASTADANGITGNGGFFWSDGTAFIPLGYAPSSANYTALPLGGSLYANFFNDGSLRITGFQGVPIPAGTYNIKGACIIYNARRNNAIAPVNVRISDASCQSTVAETTSFQDNLQTLLGNFYEYFGTDYYNGVAYIAGVENCYPGSNNGSKWFNRTMLISFYKFQLNSQGTLSPLIFIPTLDPSLALDSVAVLQYNFSLTGRATFKGQIGTIQQEPGIAVSRNNSNNIALVFWSADAPVTTGSWEVPFSLDGGLTWNTTFVNLPNQIGIPGEQMLPYPQIFQTFNFSCGFDPADGAPHCPPGEGNVNITNGTEVRVRAGIYPVSGSDNRMTVDAFDVFWQTGLYDQGIYPNGIHANAEVAFSLDYGKTWALADDITTANSTAYSYDFAIIAAGSDGANGSQFCMAVKVDANLAELQFVGDTLPIELNCFHTSQRGLVDHIDRVSMPGTEPGHYGGMTIGNNGFIYLILMGEFPSVIDPITAAILGVGVGPFGASSMGNAPIMLSVCSPSPGTVCQPAKVIARLDMVSNCPNAQPFRCTWGQPQIVVDKNDVLYVFWYDTVHNPLPTAEQTTATFEPNNQATRILMIKSCDHGESWTAPRSINDDATNPQDPFSTPNVHFNLNGKYDPITHSILLSWLDTRVDPASQTAVQIYAAVVKL